MAEPTLALQTLLDKPLLRQKMTLHEFEAFTVLPENRERRLEYIDGEAVEMVSNQYLTLVTVEIILLLGGFVKANKLGFLTPPDAGYQIGEDRLMPDIGFISRKRQPQAPHEVWNPITPDLVVEVLSPTDRANDVLEKVTAYLTVNATVWVVNPDRKLLTMYVPGKLPLRLGVEDVLDGGALLPGFRMAIKDIFPQDFAETAAPEPTE
jgi:Uma2 family endonuclease